MLLHSKYLMTGFEHFFPEFLHGYYNLQLLYMSSDLGWGPHIGRWYGDVLPSRPPSSSGHLLKPFSSFSDLTSIF